MRLARLFAGVMAAGLSLSPLSAEPILTLDWEQVYAGSLWGARVEANLRAQSSALVQENTRIAADLEAEERRLTERRPGLTADQFRAEADAFDARVTGIRAARDAKAQALSASAEAERARFIRQSETLLDDILRARGAALVIDQRAVVRGLASADISQELRAKMDAAHGDGAAVMRAPDAPRPEAKPATP